MLKEIDSVMTLLRKEELAWNDLYKESQDIQSWERPNFSSCFWNPASL